MLKVSDIKVNVSENPLIIKEYSVLIKQIDEDILTASRAYKHSVTVTVPIVFSIPNVQNAAAQRVIYYKILTSLLQRGFETRIDLSSTSAAFIISWISEKEQQEIDAQTNLIAKYSRKK
jgi:hypothetical protein